MMRNLKQLACQNRRPSQDAAFCLCTYVPRQENMGVGIVHAQDDRVVIDRAGQVDGIQYCC